MINKRFKVLREVFGHDKFKPFQEEIIESIMSGNDTLGILPTGGGKSLCYELPCLLSDGISVVISPLIALMQDQIKALNELNLKAFMINSQQSSEVNFDVIQKARRGEVKFLYLSPERLALGDFVEFLRSLQIDYFVIDEAHCVSAWGHEFRSDYRKLGVLKELFPAIPIVAFTATATRKVQEDIILSLHLKNPKVFRAKTKRDNLFIRVEKRVANGTKQILTYLKNHKNECGIIYTFTRKEAERVAKFLQQNRFSAMAYHAGLSSEQRDKVYECFAYEKIQIVVATIAFGMGIDKSNIRFVIHTSLPKTIENYYQEIGRAGRDGENSYAYLLFAKSDQVGRAAQIQEASDEGYKKLSLQKLDKMYNFCIFSKCRHLQIAAYFEDEIEPCGSLCDNCTRGEVEMEDITIFAQKLLSCVYRTNQTFGATHIIDILRGSKSKRIFELEHENLSVYGVGKELDKKQWVTIVERLLDKNALHVNEYKSLQITPNGMEILKGNKKIEIEKSLLCVNEVIEQDEEPQSINDEIFEAFRTLRKTISQETEVPAYIVFDDKTLRQISQTLPSNEKEFLQINGVGEIKLQKYGKEFLSLSKELKEKHKEEIPQTKLTDTHFQTLELLQEGSSIEEVAQKRAFTLNTILVHVKILTEHQKITKEKKEELLKPIKIPQDIQEWIEKGLLLAQNKELRNYLFLYEFLEENQEKENEA